MRVSERHIFDSATRRLEYSRERLTVATSQASSGQRVARAKDDPAAAALLVRHEAVRARAASIEKSAGTALDDLDAVDAALGEAGGALEEALALAIQMSNDTFNAGDRAAAAPAADELLKAFVSALNVESDGRFLLSGTRDDQPAFSETGVYQGDDGVRRIEVAPGVNETVSVRADIAIAGTNGGVDIPATLTTLRDALVANDAAGIRSSIGALHESVRQLSTLRSDVGARGLTLQSAVAIADGVQASAQRGAATAGDIDITEAATEMAFAQRAFEAAVQASARSFEPTLLNALR
jgi:flagellar hook-associated protein 3 FlgL